MGVSISVTFNRMWPSDEIMAVAKQYAEKLRDSHGELEQFHVTVDGPRARRGKGRNFTVCVNVTTADTQTPGELLATGKAGHPRSRTAVTNAFRALGQEIRRQAPLSNPASGVHRRQDVRPTPQPSARNAA